MGRFGIGETLHRCSEVSSAYLWNKRFKNGTTNVSITAVSNTNKAYIVMASQSSSQPYGNAGTDVQTRSGGADSMFGVRLTSTTNVAVSCPNLDMWSGYTNGKQNRNFQRFCCRGY